MCFLPYNGSTSVDALSTKEGGNQWDKIEMVVLKEVRQREPAHKGLLPAFETMVDV